MDDMASVINELKSREIGMRNNGRYPGYGDKLVGAIVECTYDHMNKEFDFFNANHQEVETFRKNVVMILPYIRDPKAVKNLEFLESRCETIRSNSCSNEHGAHTSKKFEGVSQAAKAAIKEIRLKEGLKPGEHKRNVLEIGKAAPKTNINTGSLLTR